MFEQLREENQKLKGNEGGGGGADVSALEAMLSRKQAELAAVSAIRYNMYMQCTHAFI